MTPFSSRLARRFGILDTPDPDPLGKKQHKAATPYLGGTAIFLGLLCGASLLLILSPSASQTTRSNILTAIGIALTIGVVGLIDDVRPLPRSVRVMAQLTAATGAWVAGFQVSATPWVAIDFLVTVLWIVGITNAFNLLDNMDGLSAGLAGVSALSFGVLGVLSQIPSVTIASASLAGGSFGFLAHNRHPAKIFMGDAGSTLIGFLLALIGIKLRFENLQTVTFLVPVVILGIPIFDTTLVVLSRVKHGRSVFEGGTDHVSHRLVRVGLPVRAAVGLLYFSGLCLGWLGLVISRSNTQVGVMLLGFVVVLGAYLGALLSRVPAHSGDATGIQAVQEPVDIELISQQQMKRQA